MATLFLSLLTLTLILILWNYRSGRHIHQWSNDSKNLYVWLRIVGNEKPFQRDFLSGKVRVKAYMPLCLFILNFFRRLLGSIEKSAFACHICLTTAFVFGWGITFYIWTGSVLAALLGFMVVIPQVHAIAGDTLSAGVPGNWTPRFWSNAALPWFFLLLTLSFNNPWLFIINGLISSVIFHLHPVTGIITYVVLMISIGLGLEDRSLPFWSAFLAFFVASIGPLFFQVLYRSETSGHMKFNKEQISTYNILGFNRFSLWPYPNSVIGTHLGTAAQTLIGCIFLIAIFFLMDGIIAEPPQNIFLNSLTLLHLLNIIICALMVMRMEPYGYVLLFFASSGIFGFSYGWPLLPVLFFLCYQYRYQGKFHQPLLALLSITPLMGLFLNQLPVVPATALSRLFGLMVPAIYMVYLCLCLFHYRIAPYCFNRPIMNVDFGRILKGILLTPVYLAVTGLDRSIERLSSDFTGHRMDFLIITTLIYCFWRYKKNYRAGNEDSEDLKVFYWIRENLPEDVLIHAVSNLPPLQDPDRPETSSFAFRLRAIAQRSITGCWKDGGALYYFSPFDFFDWRDRMNAIRDVLREKNLSGLFRQAQEFGADVIVYPSQMNDPSEKLWGRRLATFPRYTIHELPRKDTISSCAVSPV